MGGRQRTSIFFDVEKGPGKESKTREERGRKSKKR